MRRTKLDGRPKKEDPMFSAFRSFFLPSFPTFFHFLIFAFLLTILRSPISKAKAARTRTPGRPGWRRRHLSSFSNISSEENEQKRRGGSFLSFEFRYKCCPKRNILRGFFVCVSWTFFLKQLRASFKLGSGKKNFFRPFLIILGIVNRKATKSCVTWPFSLYFVYRVHLKTHISPIFLFI